MRFVAAIVATCAVFGARAVSAEELRCRDYADGKRVAVIDTKRVAEASGLVASETQPGVFWTHNDSGGEARLYALDEDGQLLATVDVAGASAVDWEDVALGPCTPNAEVRGCLYVSDTGDNGANRDKPAIYRVEEPAVGDDPAIEVEAEVMFVAFDEPTDVEALFLDGQATLWLVSKHEKHAELFRLGVFAADETIMAESVAERGDVEFVTGAAATADGTRVVLRSGDRAWELFRPKGRTMKSAFLGDLLQVELDHEQQGEAVAYAPDGSGFYSTSEGKGAPIRWYRCKKWGSTLSGKEDSGGIVLDPAEPTSGCTASGDYSQWALLLALLVVPMRRRPPKA